MLTLLIIIIGLVALVFFTKNSSPAVNREVFSDCKIYKYRGGNEAVFERDLQSLKRNSLWASDIGTLNDKWEGTFNRSVLEGEFAKSKVSEKLKKKFAKEIDNIININFDGGIFSSSLNWQDETLWALYSNERKGFCIEYNTKYLFKETKVPFRLSVTYASRPANISYKDFKPENYPANVVKKVLGYKSLKWAYEEEVRLIFDYVGEWQYHPKSVSAIIFGDKITKKHQEKLLKTLKGRGIEFYKLTPVEGEYRFTKEKVINQFDSISAKPVIQAKIPDSIEYDHLPDNLSFYQPFLKVAAEIHAKENYVKRILSVSLLPAILCPLIYRFVIVYKSHDGDVYSHIYTVDEICFYAHVYHVPAPHLTNADKDFLYKDPMNFKQSRFYKEYLEPEYQNAFEEAWETAKKYRSMLNTESLSYKNWF